MRLTTKRTVATGCFRPHPFIVKKDKKIGLVVLTPISWSSLSEEDYVIQWVHCKNILWELEKEGTLSRDIFLHKFYIMLEKLGYKKEEINKIKRLKDWEVPYSLLTTSYLISIGANYKPARKYFIKTVKELLSKVEEVKEQQPIITISKDRIIASKIIGEIQDLEDDIFKNNVDFNEWVKEKNLSYTIAQHIKSFFAPRLKEVAEIFEGKDEQLNEAYRKLTMKQKAYMARWYLNLNKALGSVQEKERKQPVRKARSKTPDQIVKKLKYAPKHEELGIVSIQPKKILDASKLWVYNSKLRKLIYYASDSKFEVNGTYIGMYNENESTSKILRKPEIQMKEFLNGGKAHMLQYFKSIKSKEQPVNGKISKDCVLLKTY